MVRMPNDHELRRQQVALELEAASGDVRRSLHAATRAQGIGFVTSAIGLLVFLAGMSLWEQGTHRTPLAATLCLFSGCGLAAFPIGVSAGWLAHRMYYETRIPVPIMAVTFALLIDFSIFGWIIVAM